MPNKNQMINIADGFQYAINIGYDANDINKVKNYIFTSSTLDVFTDLFDSVYSDASDKSHFLVGSYGKGKSHLALVLTKIISLSSYDDIESVLSQIKNLDSTVAARIESFYKQNKKLLPVIIQNKNNENLSESFMNSLKTSLKNEKLLDLLPSSYFTSACEKIDFWKNQYKNTYKDFCSKIENTKLKNVKTLIAELENFSLDAYKTFTAIYPELTSGSEFVPDVQNDVISFYRDVNTKLANYGYNGIYVVFDEFSKYLEAKSKESNAEDLKLLQDFAEAANRSSKNEQLHILLITHQSLLNYVDTLEKSQVDSWKAVSNRFTELHINTSSTQYYSLISKVILHNEKVFEPFYNRQIECVKNVCGSWRKNRTFSDYDSRKMFEICKNVFPLHPSVLYLLPILSEKVAQNERTIFTFLASKTQTNTLFSFLSMHDFVNEQKLSYITSDILYDYFSPLFEHESYKNKVFQIDKKVCEALQKIENKIKDENTKIICKKIIKTLGIIYIVEKFEIIDPTENTLTDIYDFENPKIEIQKAIKSLTENKILCKSEISENLNFVEYANANIDEIIKAKVIDVKKSCSLVSILNDFVKNKAFYPVEYNTKNSITRFFKIEFIENENLSKKNYNDSIKQKFADGIFYCVLENEATTKTSPLKYNFINDAICIYLKKSQKKIENIVYKYKAINDLLEKENDSITKSILQSFIRDYEDALLKFTNKFLSPELKESVYFVYGTEIKNPSKLTLDKTISSYLAKKFINYPVVLCEMVNKTEISAQAKRASISLLNQIIKNDELIPLFAFKPSSQEATILKSVYSVNKVYIEKNGKIIFNPLSVDVKNANKNLFEVLTFIDNYIKNNCNTEKSFYELYEKLYIDFGLRKGLIPLLLGSVFAKYKERIYFTVQKDELLLTGDLLFDITENPAAYKINITDWNAEIEKYLEKLETLFSSFIDFTEKNSNRPNAIVCAMQKWFTSLAKYTKSSLTENYKKLLRPLSFSKINVNEYLFNTLFLSNEKIENIKTTADNFIEQKVLDIQNELFTMFASKNQAEFVQKMNTWYLSLEENVKNHIFNFQFSKILKSFSVSKIENMSDFIHQLIFNAIDIRIEDWNTESYESFIDEIKNCKLSYESYQKKLDESSIPRTTDKKNDTRSNENAISNTPYAIQFLSKDKKSVVKTFDFHESKESAYRLMMSEIKNNMAEYQDSLSKDEKCSVLFTLMTELLEI